MQAPPASSVPAEEALKGGWTEATLDEAVVGHIACRRAGGRGLGRIPPLLSGQSCTTELALQLFPTCHGCPSRRAPVVQH
jgi:hypothetical protein